MIQCENCNTPYFRGTLFCPECGARLLKVTSGKRQRWSHACFLLPRSGRRERIALSDSSPILIGRADPDNEFHPQLDLTLEGGLDKGVSRQHATIFLTSATPVLVDKSSANGTWIGDVKLEPERPYSLPESGRLRFGLLDVYVFLE